MSSSNPPSDGSAGGAPAVPRTALVTGAGGGGVGTAVAHRLARTHHVLLNGAPRHLPALEELAAAIRAAGGSAEPLVADVTDRDGLRAALAGRPVDAFVHNAAPSLPHRPVHLLSPADWRGDVEPVLGGALNGVGLVAPGMIERGTGRIVLVSSSAAFRGTFGRSASYAAAKAALHGLVAQLALELGPYGITANAVAPSQVATPRALRGGRRTPESLSRQAAAVPLRRVGEPDDVASLIAYLCGAPAGYLTGQVIRIDGGSSLASPTTMTTEMNT
ncbi:SDR family NAD(P)-dependent oxidoreductase [Kitasatospora sp. NPDC127111]|uniref:SDR family NAD(P)-dependent oxidoreductase n=1 Tax=Kitasatospora sp. NPDC127111 TaxID=3345363 RepID=UPI00363158BA